MFNKQETNELRQKPRTRYVARFFLSFPPNTMSAIGRDQALCQTASWTVWPLC